MATATEGYAYSRSSSFSAARSPDTASPIYPERAIRPLPNRRLKSRLSPEQQSSIIYPPDPPPMSPTLNFHVQENGARGGTTNGGLEHEYEHDHGHDHDHDHHHHHHHHDAIPVHDHCMCKHDEGDSGDEEVEFDHPDYRYATTGPLAVNGKAPLDSVQRRLMEASRGGKQVGPGSVASSADGYESFENTSNKKKRKIPLSSASSMHQSSLSAEMASMGINNFDGTPDEYPHAQRPHHAGPGSSPSGTGISGAGRGRYGRQTIRDVRRPLANGTMNTINGYGPKAPARSVSGSEVRSVDISSENTGGIISQAIKTAAEQGPLTPQKGKENVSLLQQSASHSVTPKTQFTFTCESDSASKMVDQQQAMADAAYRAGYGTPTPGHHRGASGQGMTPGSRMHAQGTQTTPSRNGTAPRAPVQPNTVPAAQPPPPNQQQPAPAPKPKPRRRPSKEYALAARQRKLQQEYTNYHHRPTGDNLWICEFCEYEDIFGVPPYALIRSYEIKDRQERKKAAEKRRLLEKAKMKNRKGKKGGKGGKNNNSAAAPPAPAGGPGAYDPNLPPPEGDDYYDDDEYGDEYEPVGPDDQYPADYYPPPPAPASTPAVRPPAAGGGGEAVG